MTHSNTSSPREAARSQAVGHLNSMGIPVPAKLSMEAVLDLISQITAWVPPAPDMDPIPYLERFLQVLPHQRAAPPIDRTKDRRPYRLSAFLRGALAQAQAHQPKLIHMVSNVDDWRPLEQKG